MGNWMGTSPATKNLILAGGLASAARVSGFRHGCEFHKSQKKRMGHPKPLPSCSLKGGTHQVKLNLSGRAHVQEGPFYSMVWAHRKNYGILVGPTYIRKKILRGEAPRHKEIQLGQIKPNQNAHHFIKNDALGWSST